MRAFLQHTIGMLAAGVLASGLVLAAWALSPKPEPPAGSEHSATHEQPQFPVGRWAFVKPSNDRAFVEFTEYGNWFGSDGCNGTQGGWRLDGTALRMRPSGLSTFVWCNNANLPSGVITGSLLPSGDLELSGSEGDTVTLTRTGESGISIVGGIWMPSNGWESRFGVTQPENRPSISFADDGTWAGTDGCNRMNGSWSWKHAPGGPAGFGARLELGSDTGSTKVACEQHSDFPIELTDGRWFAVDERNLLFWDPEATEDTSGIVFLTRVDPALLETPLETVRHGKVTLQERDGSRLLATTKNSAAAHAARNEGTLATNDRGCLVTESAGTQRPVVFPYGTVPDGKGGIATPYGSFAAGARVVMGGGTFARPTPGSREASAYDACGFSGEVFTAEGPLSPDS